MDSQSKWKKRGLAALAVVGLLATAGLVYASSGAEGGHGGGLSHEKLMDLLWRTLNFAALVIILVKFLSKPIANGLRNRQRAIREQFEELESRKAEAEQLYKEYEGKLASIDAEVASIVENAVAQAEVERERILAEAHRSADDIKRQAEMAVQHEMAAAQQRLRAEVAEQATTMAEELLKSKLQPADQDKLVAEYLDRVGGLQ